MTESASGSRVSPSDPAFGLPSRHYGDLTFDERVGVFEDHFDREVEHYFSSSVACCTRCVDRFVEDWPGTLGHDDELAYGAREIHDFIAESRLVEAFTPEEIEALLPHLPCPNCGLAIEGEFWIYEHPFSIPRDFPLQVAEIATIARRSPFLLLDHPFARRALEAIRAVSHTAAATPLARPLFRARLDQAGEDPGVADFYRPPSSDRASEGRYNHLGHAMWYLAETAQTARAEMHPFATPLWIASLDMAADVRVLDLTPSRDVGNRDEELLQILAHSALCGAPRRSSGWNRPEYVFTRFIADCALNEGFDAIRYGSTRGGAANVVLLDPSPDLIASAVVRSVERIDPPAG